MLSICAVVVSVDFDMAVRIAYARQTSFGIVFVSDGAAGGSLDAPDPVFRIVLEMQPVSSRGCHGLKISQRIPLHAVEVACCTRETGKDCNIAAESLRTVGHIELRSVSSVNGPNAARVDRRRVGAS